MPEVLFNIGSARGRSRRNGRISSPELVFYTLRDEFSDTLAVDAVNGTVAVPGPGGARTVADTASKISVANNALSVNGGVASPNWGDPSLWYPETTKVSGLMLFVSITPSATNKECGAGFDNQASGSTYLDKGLQFRDTGTINAVRTSAVATCVVGSYSATTAYRLMTVLRASGGICFVKGGAYTNWTLLWIDDSTNLNATVYPAIMGKNMVFTADYARIPKTLWLPSPLASDSFNRDNGAIGSTDGAGHAESTGLGAGGSGLVWTGATWTIATNVALNTPTLSAELLVDPGVETWTSATNLTAYTEQVNGTSTVNREATTIHGGTYSCRLDVDASSSLVGIGLINPTVGVWYKQTAYAMRGATAATLTMGQTDNSVTFDKVLTADWAEYLVTFRPSTTSEIIWKRASGTSANASIYLDDLSVKSLTLSSLFSSVSVSAQDVIATVNVTRGAGLQAGLVLNLDSTSTPANFIVAYLDGAGNAKLEKCLAGTYTSLISAAVTYSAGAPLRVMKKGLSYELYYNNLRVGTGWTANAVTDADIISNTKHGLFSTDVSNTFDSFTVYDSGSASGAYEILNNF